MLKVQITYPSLEDERLVMRQNTQNNTSPKLTAVVQPAQILEARELVKKVYMDEKIEQYILDIVFATRQPENYKLAKLKPLIQYGVSPRATISLAIASKAYAFIKGRGYVIPDDIRAVAMDVMRHRLGLTYEAEAENITPENIIVEILNAVEVP
jgi:MoxR-like ATPase